MDDPANGEKDDGSEEAPVFSDISTSPVSPPESRPQRNSKDVEMKPHLNTNTTRSRVKSSSRRRFLDNSLSDEEEAGDSVENVMEECLRAGPPDASKDRGSDAAVAEPDSSWMCPLTLDELSMSPTDTETEQYSALQPVHQSLAPNKAQVRSKTCSGVILKLRRLFSEGLNRKKARYQAVSDSGTLDNPSLSKNKGLEGDERTTQATHKSRRTGGFAHALRPLRSSSKRKHRSLLKIKYCPYLSACHSAEHRRRWVLRSAVHRAQGAHYPDLVGKRVRHLYEEDDKSEVWYRGEVVRVHEANADPLKTIFEVRYDSEPEWKYYLELLIDYKKGWLKIDD